MEKTFEELIDESLNIQSEVIGFKLSTLDKLSVLELLKQVRKATIDECLGIVSDYFEGDQTKSGFIYAEIEKSPTNRIIVRNENAPN